MISTMISGIELWSGIRRSGPVTHLAAQLLQQEALLVGAHLASAEDLPQHLRRSQGLPLYQAMTPSPHKLLGGLGNWQAENDVKPCWAGWTLKTHLVAESNK